ncbi:MAG: DUF3857 domain-containing protein [Gemmataceae bacterium]|nr:DUF3857 domain-containing protein [Gemmataceae bacterium]
MTGKFAGRIPLLISLIVLSPAASRAEVDWPIPRGASNEPVPFKYDATHWKAVPKAFIEDAPACTLYSGTTHLVDSDGVIETITHEVTRLSSRKALDKLGEYRAITYTPEYEKLTLNEARVIKADGRSVPVEAKHVQLRDQGTDFQVYDRGKVLVISFPTLEVGDCYEVKWTVRGKNPEHAGHFFTRYTFGDDRYPVVCDEVRVRLPKTRELKHAVTGGKLDPEVKEEGGHRTYHWRVANRKQLPQDDNLPSKEELRQQVSCSTFSSWDAVLKWKQQLRQDCWKCTPEVRQIAVDVTKDLKTPQEKARALTYWVRRHIRYVSMGEKHDYTPHTPAQVLKTRYGDCKDTSQLLAVMLRECGIEVSLATLGVQDDGQVLEEVPSPWGTHAILMVTIDGQQHWIDTTASLAAWDYLPSDDRNRLCYVTDDKGLRLLRTPRLTPERDRVEQTTHMTIGADGSSRAERISVYHGAAAYNRRHDWVEVPGGERRRLLTAELQDANSQTRLTGLDLDDAKLKDFDEPVTARFVYEIAGHFAGDEREGSITDSPVWGKLLAVNLDYDRQATLDLGSPFESIHTYTIRLPLAFRHDALPRDKHIKSKFGSFRMTVKPSMDDPRQIEVRYRTRLEKVRVEPADFDAYRKFHQEVSKSYRFWLALKPTRDAADIAGLEALMVLTPGDSASAAVLASLHLKAEKPEEARRVLRRAQHYNPNDVALLELAVKAAGSVEEEEGAYRVLVKRFPKELKYSVLLGETLIRGDKHAPARTILQAVVKNGSAIERAGASYQLARSALMENKAKEALKHFEAASEADEDTVYTAPALTVKGKVHEKLNQPKEAAEAYRQALKLEAEATEALDGLVRLALAAKNSSEALDVLRRYSVAVGSEPAGLARVADYHLRLGRTEDAFDLANRALGEGAKGAAHRTLGLVYSQRGDHEKAIAHLDQTDLDAAVLEALIRGQLALGHLGSALQRAERADKVGQPTAELLRACSLCLRLAQRRKAVASSVQAPAGNPDAWDNALDRFVCAELAYQDGRPSAQVEAILEQAFADKVELGPAFALRGLLALDKGRLGRALADAARAITLSPKDSRGYFVRGRVRLERGDKEALADLAKAAELGERKDGVVLHWLATALAQAGRKADALAAQREAVKLRPTDRELAEQLREFEQSEKDSTSGQ